MEPANIHNAGAVNIGRILQDALILIENARNLKELEEIRVIFLGKTKK